MLQISQLGEDLLPLFTQDKAVELNSLGMVP
jgi:hypothetical protein